MTLKDIARVTKMHRTTIWRRAKKEGWPHVVKKGIGGSHFDYPLASIPTDIRRKLINPELIRDKTLDWFERLMNSPWLERTCWIAIVLAVLYFGPVVVRILMK